MDALHQRQRWAQCHCTALCGDERAMDIPSVVVIVLIKCNYINHLVYQSQFRSSTLPFLSLKFVVVAKDFLINCWRSRCQLLCSAHLPFIEHRGGGSARQRWSTIVYSCFVFLSLLRSALTFFHTTTTIV